MRVASRVAAGSALPLILLVAVLSYHLTQVERLVGVNRRLAAVNFRAATAALALSRDIDQIDEYTRKLFVTRDTGYAEGVADALKAARSRLDELGQLGLSAEESTVLERLCHQWEVFPFAAADAGTLAAASRAANAGSVLKAATEDIDAMRLQARAVFAATQAAVAEQVGRATRAAEAVGRVSLAVIGLALLVSVATVVLTVRSISVPLRHLTEGTRKVAAGHFSTQLTPTGHDELAELAEDFNAMVRRLGELDQLKRDFVSHVSHELKTPLVAMEETIRLLLEEEIGPLSPQQRRMLELNLQACTRLSAMISDLLDISRMESGSLTYELGAHDLGLLLERAAGELEALAAERGVVIRVEPPEPALSVLCDADRVVQVVQNLLHNAIRFSPQGEMVRLVGRRLADLGTAELPPSGESDRLDGSRFAAVSVLDRGPGVPGGERARIFERFRQLGSPAERRGGVGLGLAICKRIVDDHGGAIWVGGGSSPGCELTFVLPLATSPRPPRLKERQPGRNA